jgi:mRNA interferase RelE/StbE
LTGKLKGYYRFRIGDYRVIYRVDDDGRLVIVALITHRSKAYD